MKIYGGMQMCDLFAWNFGGPFYNCTNREKKKRVQFIAGEHFVCLFVVAHICKEAKDSHQVEGLVPIILAEGKIKVKYNIFFGA